MQQETRNKYKIAIIVGVLTTVILAGAGGWWYYSSSRISTDDARVKGTIIPVSSKTQSRIVEVLVENGTPVTPGMILARLDSSEINAQLEQAKANLVATKAKLAAAQAGNRTQEVAQASAGAAEAAAPLPMRKEVMSGSWLYMHNKDVLKDYVSFSFPSIDNAYVLLYDLFKGHGINDIKAQKLAIKKLHGLVVSKAAVLSYQDVFLATACISAIGILAALFIQDGRKRGKITVADQSVQELLPSVKQSISVKG